MARELLSPMGAAMFVYSPHSRATFQFIYAKLEELARNPKKLCWQETHLQTAYGYKVHEIHTGKVFLDLFSFVIMVFGFGGFVLDCSF